MYLAVLCLTQCRRGPAFPRIHFSLTTSHYTFVLDSCICSVTQKGGAATSSAAAGEASQCKSSSKSNGKDATDAKMEVGQDFPFRRVISSRAEERRNWKISYTRFKSLNKIQKCQKYDIFQGCRDASRKEWFAAV